MRPLLIASVAALVLAGEAAAQIERLNIPEPRGERGRPGGPPRPRPSEALFIAPSGEPFRAPSDGPYPVAAWFARADADHDGRLTLKEFTDDSLAFFEQLDANKDGTVDGFEAQAYERTIVPEIAPGGEFAFGPTPRRSRGLFGGRGPVQGPAEGAALYGLLNEPQPVSGSDGDLDRKISRAEAIAAAGRRFRRLDTDGDGVLTLGALPKTHAQLEHEQALTKGRPEGPRRR